MANRRKNRQTSKQASKQTNKQEHNQPHTLTNARGRLCYTSPATITHIRIEPTITISTPQVACRLTFEVTCSIFPVVPTCVHHGCTFDLTFNICIKSCRSIGIHNRFASRFDACRFIRSCFECTIDRCCASSSLTPHSSQRLAHRLLHLFGTPPRPTILSSSRRLC